MKNIISSIMIFCILNFSSVACTNEQSNITTSDKIGDWLMHQHDLNHTGFIDKKAIISTNPTLMWKWKSTASLIVQPVVGDIDNDGITEVLIGSEDLNLYCLNGETGIEEWRYSIGNQRAPISPILADVDNDNNIEILIVFKIYGMPPTQDYLHVLTGGISEFTIIVVPAFCMVAIFVAISHIKRCKKS